MTQKLEVCFELDDLIDDITNMGAFSGHFPMPSFVLVIVVGNTIVTCYNRFIFCKFMMSWEMQKNSKFVIFVPLFYCFVVI